MSYFTLNDGMKLYIEDTKKGDKTVIMLHGWTSNHEIFSKPVTLLKNSARCITYDQRGHFKSRNAGGKNVTMETLADDLQEIIKRLSLSDVTLIGWSMGAGVAMTYAKKYGCGRLKQVILCDMTPKQINDEKWRLGLDKGRYTAQDLEKDKDKNFFLIYRKFIIHTIPKLKKVSKFLLNYKLRKILRQSNTDVLQSLSTSMKTQDNRDALKKITVPLTYFYASPGSLFTPALEKWYRKNAVSEFKSVKFSNCTHMMIAEKPEFFAEQVRKLI